MKDLERYFKGLADVTRLRIVNLLTWGELCGCDIQRVLEASQPNVSRHLTYLKHAGLVVDRREGYRVFYRLVEATDATIKSLFDFVAAAFRHDEAFRADLRRLKDAVKDGACTIPQGRLVQVKAAGSRPAAKIKVNHRKDLVGLRQLVGGELPSRAGTKRAHDYHATKEVIR